MTHRQGKMSKTSTDDSEVVFEQLRKDTGVGEQEGPTPSPGNEETWLADTELHRKDRRRAMEFDRPINEELGAALGGEEDNNSMRDDGAPESHPEQQIRDEEEMQTPPRRQPRGVGSQQPKGPRVGMDESTSGPGYMAVPPAKPMGRSRLCSEWSPVETLEGTVSRMKRDLDNLQTENRFLRTRRATGPVPLVRQAALTTTKVPWFSGSTSWEQYQQVFDAIVLSNGWDDATAALQLLSHLQGDALSVALLIPMPRRASRKELTDALSSHYGSPGRLASYRRQFDKTERKPGEDPANFGITLETLAVKAFGDIGQTSRLQLIRDRFIAGHESCELRRHLDCLPPDTPLRDIVDQCRVWESHPMMTTPAEICVSQSNKEKPSHDYKTAVAAVETDANGTREEKDQYRDIDGHRTATRAGQMNCGRVAEPVAGPVRPVIPNMNAMNGTDMMHYEWIVRESV